jgi:hypothetical protein
MARIRTIKPEFWSDETICECTRDARLLFIGLLNFADDCGNLDRSAKQIKTRVFPNDKIDCEPLLSQLLMHGLIIEYSVNNKKYLHIRGFQKHQLINRPSKPVVPQYAPSLNTQGALTEPSLITHSGKEGKGMEGKEEEKTAAPVIPSTVSQEAWDKWNDYRKKIKKPVKPVSHDDLAKAFEDLGDHAAQKAAVQQSIANGWTGLFAAKSNGSNGNARPALPAPNHDAAWAVQKERAKAMGFREPHQHETPASYKTAIDMHENRPRDRANGSVNLRADITALTAKMRVNG